MPVTLFIIYKIILILFETKRQGVNITKVFKPLGKISPGPNDLKSMRPPSHLTALGLF